MKKSDKKYENGLRVGLTDLCERDLKGVDGFQWLTHIVDYNRFPESLKIILIFDTPQQVEAFCGSSEQTMIEQKVSNLLQQLKIKVSAATSHVMYDNETDCALQHQGNWDRRLSWVS